MRLVRGLLAMLAAGLCVIFVSWTVARNEQTIAQGRDVFVELRPVDPLSLVQGYYMILNMQVDLAGIDLKTNAWVPTQGVVFGLDDRNVATPRRLHKAGDPLADDEVVMPVGKRNNQFTVLPASFLFQEGKAKVYERARFGQFRALEDGRAVLVGLADVALEPLVSVKRTVEGKPVD